MASCQALCAVSPAVSSTQVGSRPRISRSLCPPSLVRGDSWLNFASRIHREKTNHSRMSRRHADRGPANPDGSNSNCGSGRGRGLVVVRASSSKRVRLKLLIEHQVQFGESMAVVGSPGWLGRWKDPVQMQWSEAGWMAEIDARGDEEAEFKFVVCGQGGSLAWENGPNRKLQLPRGGEVFAVAKWDLTSDDQLRVEVQNAQDHKAKGHSGNDSNGSATASSSTGSGHNGVLRSGGGGDSRADESEFAKSWQGRDVSFMRSNEHSRDRRGRWDTEGLSGPALAIVEGDRGAGNWWRKLEVVESLLTPLGPNNRLEALIYSAIYLQWISTGQIACVEDGGHHRPNRHAEISRRIFRWLEKDPVQAHAVSPQAVVAMRKIHPRLPAFSAEFTASVPLTRIRDIAHRNDIPHDLKQEIKHTIQNKLHRNAGPEDLVATEALLRRVTQQPGQYSEAFVEQLRIFYAELKDFFNASSLTEQLDAIRGSFEEGMVSALESFLAAKQKVDSLPVHTNGNGASNGGVNGVASGPVDVLLAALHALTGLRAGLLYRLESGLRNDAPDEAIAMRQKWRLAEIGLEEYAFVLLSRFLNEVDRAGGAQSLISDVERGSAARVDTCLGAAVLSLRQLGLSGWQQAECLVLEHELVAWQAAGMAPKDGGGVVTADDRRFWALRLKASLDRVRRLTESYTEALLAIYMEPSKKLGKALGVEDNAVRTFTEAEIRASVVFQLDKLASLLLRVLRKVLGAEGWDVLMQGTASGVLHEVEAIEPAVLDKAKSTDTILLVHRADGDEEVGASNSRVRGVILLQELPHMSHLAVRARQEQVAFVTCEDEDRIAELRSMLGQQVTLTASSDAVGVSLGVSAKSKRSSSGSSSNSSSSKEQQASGGAKLQQQEGAAAATAAVALKDPVYVDETPLLVRASKGTYQALVPLHDAKLETCGAKAVSCARILDIADESSSVLTPSSSSTSNKSTLGSASFMGPKGAVIPFGMLDDALRAASQYKTFVELVAAIETSNTADLDRLCNDLRTLVSSLTLPLVTLRLLSQVFPPDARLIVRSSANVEDLKGMSGAGLYDSIPNVRLADPAAFSRAVASVWASLFTRRAVLSRRAAGVKQAEAAMAVLVQELVAPHLSFVLHTKGPVDGRTDEVHVELAPGLGETLASGTRGTPWRVAVHKETGAVRILALANFSEQLVVSTGSTGGAAAADGTMLRKRVDYSEQQLSVRRERLETLGRQLGAVGVLLEKRLGGAQDVEGCLVADKVFIVQSRPQP